MNGSGDAGQSKLRPLREKLQVALDNVRVEQRVFYRLSQATRDDSASALYGIAMHLTQLETLLNEILMDLEAI